MFNVIKFDNQKIVVHKTASLYTVSSAELIFPGIDIKGSGPLLAFFDRLD